MKKTKCLFFIFLVIFCSSCGHSSSRIKRESKKIEPAHQATKLFPPLTDQEADYYRNLFKDSHVEIRLAAASVLMSHGDRSGERILLELLKGEDLHFRLESFLKLTDVPTRKIVADLQNAIEKEKDMMARFVMKRALKKAQQKLQEYEEAP